MNIIQATRRNYTALQHKPDGRRVALDVTLSHLGWHHNASLHHTHWRFWVIADTESQRKAELTRAIHRIRAMYPWGGTIDAQYHDRKQGAREL